MKKLFFALAIFAGITTMTAQEGVTMKRSSTLTLEEVPPTWPGCTGSVNQKNNCLRQKLAGHIVKNFKVPKDYTKGKVAIDMYIDTEGKPVIRDVKGGSIGVQKEVKRVIMMMPQVKPGNMGGTKKNSDLKLAFTI